MEGAGGRKYPSYVACAKDDFVGFYVEEELHREGELDGISAGFSDDSWGQRVIVDGVPFGLPVVPEVYSRYNSSVLFISSHGTEVFPSLWTLSINSAQL